MRLVSGIPQDGVGHAQQVQHSFGLQGYEFAPLLMLIPLVGLALMSILIGMRGNVFLTDISENAARVMLPGSGL